MIESHQGNVYCIICFGIRSLWTLIGPFESLKHSACELVSTGHEASSRDRFFVGPIASDAIGPTKKRQQKCKKKKSQHLTSTYTYDESLDAVAALRWWFIFVSRVQEGLQTVSSVHTGDTERFRFPTTKQVLDTDKVVMTPFPTQSRAAISQIWHVFHVQQYSDCTGHADQRGAELWKSSESFGRSGHGWYHLLCSWPASSSASSSNKKHESYLIQWSLWLTFSLWCYPRVLPSIAEVDKYYTGPDANPVGYPLPENGKDPDHAPAVNVKARWDEVCV